MFIFRLLVASVLLLAFAIKGYGAEIIVDCPAVNVKNKVFDASALKEKSTISIENGTAEYPLALEFYQAVAGGCKKIEFARYSIEGGTPVIESIFFMPLHGRINVFSIVSWGINNRGDGTYGKLYQVYAYNFDENGNLVENKHVSGDDAMTGVEGVSEGTTSEFRYRTAAQVKRYWRNKGK
jgi:hypothetical protein